MPADIAALLAEAPWLARLARSIVGDPAEADDLVQEAYAAALRSPPDTERPIRPWLRRVVVNLVDNALEAVASADERRVTVQTRYDARAEVARLVVEDTGHGIDPADRDKLFLPHFSTRARGTGLGLAIVRHIVSDHRGRIWSEPNAMTRSGVLWVTIPTPPPRSPKSMRLSRYRRPSCRRGTASCSGWKRAKPISRRPSPARR